MKQNIIACTMSCIFLLACKKHDNPIANTNFEASINGVKKIFQTGQPGANLMRSTGNDVKQMSFLGISEDSQVQLEIMIFDSPRTGDGISSKTYTIRKQNDDNPSTLLNEAEDSEDAAIRYGVFSPGIGWSSDAYKLTGKIIIQKCDTRYKQISGYFEQTGISLTNGQRVLITDAKFENIGYRIIN
jgi:hypothetical protein